jgi:hypothetical protein
MRQWCCSGSLTPTARLARVPVRAAVTQGTSKPDISSVEAFKRALLAAKFITYGDPDMGDAPGVHVARIAGWYEGGICAPKVVHGKPHAGLPPLRAAANGATLGQLRLRGGCLDLTMISEHW